MLNNILNAMALGVIVAIATAAAFSGTTPAPTRGATPLAAAPAASAAVKVVQLPTVVVVGQRDRTVAAAR